MKPISIAIMALALITSGCVLDFSPPPIATAGQNQPGGNTPIIVMATPTLTAPPPPPTAVPALSTSLLRNSKLQFTSADGTLRTAAFQDGTFQQGTDPAQPGYVQMLMGEKIAFGDLNSDGVEDAAITIVENFGGSGSFVSLLAITNQNGIPTAAASTIVDDRPMLEELSIQNGKIYLAATIHGIQDPMCCPTLQTKRFYALAANNLVMLKFSSRLPEGTERAIQIDSPVHGDGFSQPFVIKGSVSVSPFENSLACIIHPEGSLEEIEKSAINVNAEEIGGPGTFELLIDPAKINLKGNIRIEIADFSLADGTYIASNSVTVQLK